MQSQERTCLMSLGPSITIRLFIRSPRLPDNVTNAPLRVKHETISICYIGNSMGIREGSA